MNALEEIPCILACGENELVGIVHRTAGEASLGVLFIVGGPQYRAGSHRQFVLLARHFAQRGYPCMRFDSRGMGDSEGRVPGFEGLAPDIRAAIDGFMSYAPGLTRVVLWGLCDGASAAALYAACDPRVAGLVLVNPWVRTDAIEARVRMKHYYAGRLRNPDFWRKLLSGRVRVGRATVGVLTSSRRAISSRVASPSVEAERAETSVPQRMAASLQRFPGNLLVVLSEDDATAQEFVMLCECDPQWRRLMAGSRVTRFDAPEANHTFSRAEWRDRIAIATTDWLATCSRSGS